jgi:hypothetical protein
MKTEKNGPDAANDIEAFEIKLERIRQHRESAHHLEPGNAQCS